MSKPTLAEPRIRLSSQARQDLARRLGEAQCPIEDAARILGTPEQALIDGRHSRSYQRGLAEGRQALRAAQFKLAETSVTMAVFLGKTYLGQGDRQELVQSAAIDLSQVAQRVREKLARFAEAVDAERGGAGDAGLQ
jgi:hypothetical protein